MVDMTIRDQTVFTAEFYATDLLAEVSDLLRKLEDGQPLNALRVARFIDGQLTRTTEALVLELRDNDVAWCEIGEALDITRQGASQRFALLE